MGRNGDAAREALLDAAERIFAERGLEGASLRDISAAASQRNHSAAQYHFGDRSGLVGAVFARRMKVVNARRAAMVDEFDAAGRGHDLDAIVTAWVHPLVEVVCSTDGWYGRFILRTTFDLFALETIGGLAVADSLRVVRRRAEAAIADLPPVIRRSRMRETQSLIASTVAGWEWSRDRGRGELSMTMLAAELASTSLALLRAPVDLS